MQTQTSTEFVIAKLSMPSPSPTFSRGCREMPILRTGPQPEENTVSCKDGK